MRFPLLACGQTSPVDRSRSARPRPSAAAPAGRPGSASHASRSAPTRAARPSSRRPRSARRARRSRRRSVRRTASSTGPNQPSAIACSLADHPGPVAEHPAPGGEHVTGRARLAVQVPGPWPRRRAAPRRPAAPASASTSIRSACGDVDHSVIGGDVQHRAVRQGRGELLGELVDVGELVEPGVGGAAEHVPGRVEVAVVDHRERRRAPAASAAADRETSAPSVSAGRYSRAAHRRGGQAGLAERAWSRPGTPRRRPRSARSKIVEPRLPAERVDARVPAQRVQQLAASPGMATW